jgi:hypothetical protein
MTGRSHTLLALLTCGLWLIVAPAIYWARRRAFKPLVAWAVTWLVILVTGLIANGTAPPTTISTSEAGTPAQTTTPAPAAQPLTAATSTNPPAAPSVNTSTAAPKAPTTKEPRVNPKPSSKATTAPPLDPRFRTCKKAKAHGYGPYVEGEDPEYSWYRDRDHDGVVCE